VGRRSWSIAIASLVVLTLVWLVAGRPLPGSSHRDGETRAAVSTEGRAGDAGDSGEEAGDPDAGGSVDAERLAALAQAQADSTSGITSTIVRDPAPGWAGERPVSKTYDDWEPAIAADPQAPYVYRLVTRYGGPTACPKDCADPAIILQVSDDDGVTWGPSRFICTCKGTHGMYDPQIDVASGTGTVMAAFMRGYSVWFTRSNDHGQTWSTPVPVYGKVAWQDKPLLATSADGNDVYVAFNGPSGGDAFVSSSHDGGATWRVTKVTDSDRYLYAFSGTVLADGTVVYAESSLLYTGDGRHLKGASLPTVLRSTDGGQTWAQITLDKLQLGRICTSAACPPDFYDGHVAVADAADGRLVYLADGATKARGIRGVWAYTSTDGGLTWGPRVRLAPGKANAGFPAITADATGTFRAWYADRSTGRWQIWYRTTTDGTTWSDAVMISDATSGAAYKTPTGFREFYGDYGEIDVTDTGKTVAIWGEGPSYAGPGGCWFNRQL